MALHDVAPAPGSDLYFCLFFPLGTSHSLMVSWIGSWPLADFLKVNCTAPTPPTMCNFLWSTETPPGAQGQPRWEAKPHACAEPLTDPTPSSDCSSLVPTMASPQALVLPPENCWFDMETGNRACRYLVPKIQRTQGFCVRPYLSEVDEPIGRHLSLPHKPPPPPAQQPACLPKPQGPAEAPLWVGGWSVWIDWLPSTGPSSCTWGLFMSFSRNQTKKSSFWKEVGIMLSSKSLGLPQGWPGRRCGGSVTLSLDIQDENVDASQKSTSLT